MQKSSWTNMYQNDVKLVKKYVKIRTEIVEKFIKSRLRNRCEK